MYNYTIVYTDGSTDGGFGSSHDVIVERVELQAQIKGLDVDSLVINRIPIGKVYLFDGTEDLVQTQKEESDV